MNTHRLTRKSILAFSDDFYDFLENKLATPILAERGGRANPWMLIDLFDRDIVNVV